MHKIVNGFRYLVSQTSSHWDCCRKGTASWNFPGFWKWLSDQMRRTQNVTFFRFFKISVRSRIIVNILCCVPRMCAKYYLSSIVKKTLLRNAVNTEHDLTITDIFLKRLCITVKITNVRDQSILARYQKNCDPIGSCGAQKTTRWNTITFLNPWFNEWGGTNLRIHKKASFIIYASIVNESIVDDQCRGTL